MAGKDPSMPFYVNDWLSSARVQTMSPAQELAYFRLCLFCWSSQDASLPDDDEQLMRMARWPLKGGSRVVENGWPLVRVCFQPHPTKPGFLTNERVLELWEERQVWREKSRLGGKNSAAKRGGRGTYDRSKGGSTTVPTKRQPKGNSSSSSSSSSSSPSNSPLREAERERLIGLVAKQNVHNAASAVDAALARGCSDIQIEEAARVTDGKALLTVLETLKPPSAHARTKRADEAERETRERAIGDATAARLERELGALYDAMPPAKIESLLGGREHLLRVFKSQGGKDSPLVRGWVLKHLDSSQPDDGDAVVVPFSEARH